MEKACECSGVVRKSEWPLEVMFYPRAKKTVITAASVDLTGQDRTMTVEIPMVYCPKCGRKL